MPLCCSRCWLSLPPGAPQLYLPHLPTHQLSSVVTVTQRNPQQILIFILSHCSLGSSQRGRPTAWRPCDNCPATSDPKEVTPETGELSSTQADATDDTAEQDRPTNRPVPGVTHIIQLRPSPKEPSEQSDTEIVESSPEPAQDEDQDDLAGLD